MTASFLFFVAEVSTGIGYVLIRSLPRKHAVSALLGFSAWILYTGAIGYSGILSDPTRTPPGLIFFLVPILLGALFFAYSQFGRMLSDSIPLQILTGLQGFRIVVEIFLDQFWQAGLLPKMMTYHGTNFDILIGLSALVLSYFVAKGRIPKTALLAWNVLGLLVLANVVIRGILSAPGPFQILTSDVPNLAIVTFPFSYVPGLMVPLALALHILSIRRLR